MKILWTDGSASPNPGPGGYAVIENGKPVRLGRSDWTTNIRMEASALIAAMKYAREAGEECEIHTDSEFWINVITKWKKGWKARGWMKAKKRPIQNLDLVKLLDLLYDPRLVKLVWVKGHADSGENRMADKWANRARKRKSFGDLVINEVPKYVAPKEEKQKEEKDEKNHSEA